MELWLRSIIMTTAYWQSISLWTGFKVPKGWKLGIKEQEKLQKGVKDWGKGQENRKGEYLSF